MAFLLTCWHCDWKGTEAGPLPSCPACGGALEFNPGDVDPAWLADVLDAPSAKRA